MKLNLVVVGALARVAPGRHSAAYRGLAGIPGVTPFEVEPPEQLGVIIEAADLDTAHHRLDQDVRCIDAVLSAWPVWVEVDSADEGLQAVAPADAAAPA